AEDGIRDWSVTGVQTCALPISSAAPAAPRPGEGALAPAGRGLVLLHPGRPEPGRRKQPPQSANGPPGERGRLLHRLPRPDVLARSEERRVGTEGRTPWARARAR